MVDGTTNNHSSRSGGEHAPTQSFWASFTQGFQSCFGKRSRAKTSNPERKASNDTAVTEVPKPTGYGNHSTVAPAVTTSGYGNIPAAANGGGARGGVGIYASKNTSSPYASDIGGNGNGHQRQGAPANGTGLTPPAAAATTTPQYGSGAGAQKNQADEHDGIY